MVVANWRTLTPMSLHQRSVSHPHGEIHYSVENEGDEVVSFVVQLRCWVGTETELVAQFDHTPDQGMGHDVEREGVHMDVFRDGEKVDVSLVADAGLDAHPGPLVADVASEYALTYMEQENERLIERFLTWRDE